jgi:hypothetical protein
MSKILEDGLRRWYPLGDVIRRLLAVSMWR